tara:strand:+ start:142 stop:1146 length:1005 start_codon:yes stop_codon:yes gene_type:complete
MLKVKKDRYLVLGSNSFSGSNFIDHLLDKKHIVTGVSRSKEINDVFLKYKKNKYKSLFQFKKIDLNKDLKSLIKLIKKFRPSIIVNYIAQGMVAQSWDNPQDWYNTNIISQTLFYKKVLNFKFIKKIVHVSTPEVYGSTSNIAKESNFFNPSTPYAISRATMDTHLLKYFKNYKLPVIITRTSNIYGPGQQLYRLIPKAFMCIKKNKTFNLHGGGRSIRSFIYADDASWATYLVSQKGKIGETYHISDKKFILIKNVVKKISSLEKVSFEKLCKINKERIGKDHSYKLDANKIKKKLNWRAKVNLDDGLSKTKQWVDNNFNVLKKYNLDYKHKK